MIGVGSSFLNNQVIQNLGVAIINFDNDDIALQNDASSRGIGKYYTLYGQDDPAGATTAWAWGVSRLIDVLSADTSGLFDVSHLGVTGCSRNGKGALVVGALDGRIALVIPQESGSGGSASWRISDWQGAGIVQTLSEITGENVWFTESLAQFDHNATSLPFDHHMLLGMVAPRGLLVIENTGMVWLGNESCWGDSVAGQYTYQALGIPDHMGPSQVGGHNHCQFPDSQQVYVTSFIQKFLLNDPTANTTIMATDGGYTFDKAKWVDWDIPNLQ